MKDKVTRSLIRKYADQVAQQFHPNEIILFGSYATIAKHARSVSKSSRAAARHSVGLPK